MKGWQVTLMTAIAFTAGFVSGEYGGWPGRISTLVGAVVVTVIHELIRRKKPARPEEKR